MAPSQSPRTKKKRRKPESAAERLEQIESLGERMAGWVADNAVIVVVVAGVALLLAGAYGFWDSRSSTRATDASRALAAAHNDYRAAFGAKPGDLILAEPANPEVAQRVRAEYVNRFQEVAAQHPGTAEAAIAALEAGGLQHALGRLDGAEATWRAGLPGAAGQDPILGLLLLRLAAARERAGDWAEASALYEQAGRLPAFPLAALALGEAARARAMAGDAPQAIALYDESLAAADGRPAAPHIRSQLEEMRALQTAE